MAQAEQFDTTYRRGTEEGERKRKLILRELEKSGGRAKAASISDKVGFSSALVRRHCDDVLCEATPPLVERAGKERNENGMDYVVYRLTPAGETAANGIEDDDLTMEDAQSFAELRAENRRLEERVDQLEAAHNSLIKAIQKSELDVNLGKYLK